MREFLQILRNAIEQTDGFETELVKDGGEPVMDEEELSGDEDLALLVSGNFNVPPPERYLEICFSGTVCEVWMKEFDADIPPEQLVRGLFGLAPCPIPPIDDLGDVDLNFPGYFEQLADIPMKVGLSLPDQWWSGDRS